MPSEADAEGRWRELATEARACAADMTDSDARRIMLEIAAAYDVLAERAKARKGQKKSE